MKFFSTLKIKTLVINNFKGLKRFKIDELPDFVVLTGQCGVGKSSILQAISYLKEKVIYPDRQPNNSTSLISQCNDLVNSDSNACKISAKFELDQSEMDYLQEKNNCDSTNLVQNAYIKLKEGEILEDKCSTELRTLLKLYDKYSIRSIIDRFDYIGSCEGSYSKQSDTAGKAQHLPTRSKGNLSMEEKLIRVKENIAFAKAEFFDLIMNKFGNKMQLTKEDTFEFLKLFQKLKNEIVFTKYLHPMTKSKSHIFDIDDLSSQEKELLFIFTELYYRLKPTNSIILYDEPGIHFHSETNTKLITLLRKLGNNNQIWITSHPSRTMNFGSNEVIRIEDHLRN